MVAIVRFTATRLTAGKKGIITPNADGYYPMVLGALNAYNKVNEYYTLEGAKELFEASSSFMRRVRNECLKSEVNHPQFLPGMKLDDYIRRIERIDLNNVCSHISEIWLDKDAGKEIGGSKNPNLVLVMGLVKPSGVKGYALEEAINNNKENVCFSVRGVTTDYDERGKRYRALKRIITYDWVNEPGLEFATKRFNPALEDYFTLDVTRSQLANMNHSPIEYAMESAEYAMHQEILSLFKPEQSERSSWRDW